MYPKVRFRGFDEPWKKVKLGEIATTYSGGTPKAGNKKYYNGLIPFIRSGEIHSNKTELFISEAGLKNSSAKMVTKGDLLYALYGATSGEVDISKINGAINQAVLAIIPKQYNPYIISLLLSKKKDAILSKYLQGGQGNLSAEIVKSIKLILPSKNEESSLYPLFKVLDNLLSLQQRKLELEKQLKFFLFQNAIPSKEAVIFKPKIRFREFQDKWKYAKLSEIYNTDCSGGTPSVKNKTFYGGNIPFLTISDLNNKKIYKTQKTLSKKGLENSSAKLVPAGSISLAMYASVGKIGILSKEMATSQAFFNMTFDDDEKRDFIYIILEKANFDKEWIRLISTGTQNNLNAKKIRNFHIVFPTYKALKGLNKLFCNIDTDIDIQYKVIVTTNQLKQFLLQNLFI
ncbi:restriction endonuclease subunit S [Lactobacillus jensenii]|nr:restriction endonuclease subunit S [Lactobacillus jensenii]MDK6812067.1 restriction endonuclease subunit S [Lactobacillus jensenii]MDK8616567.1 restriction endonuclease subunit S [Lactobacillus jensenii]MDT9545707.1 restriction endonuclease subunit S [Lactobacillus jensenii]MDX5076169.1 restriction endonuclease subunit S [Lactobacillus jensenii]